MASREELIISEIKSNPGIRFRELMKKVGITNGVMSYYLRKLEQSESVWIAVSYTHLTLPTKA